MNCPLCNQECTYLPYEFNGIDNKFYSYKQFKCPTKILLPLSEEHKLEFSHYNKTFKGDYIYSIRYSFLIDDRIINLVNFTDEDKSTLYSEYKNEKTGGFSSKTLIKSMPRCIFEEETSEVILKKIKLLMVLS